MRPSPDPPDTRTLAADLFGAHSEAVMDRLVRRRRSIDEHLATEAVVRAIMELAADFSRHDPALGTVRGLLFGMARRALGRLLRREARLRERERKKAEEGVTKSPPAGREPVDDLADKEHVARALAELAPGPEERALLELYLSGERSVEVWATALAIAWRPLDEQQAEVSRALARLRQKLCRFRARAQEEGP